MNGTLLKISSDMAHFKNSGSAVLQQTYKVPPISTVVGILKNIYKEDIKDFIFGYNFTYSSSQYEISTLYKEVNPNVQDSHSDKFKISPSQIEYLINPRLEVIIIGLNDDLILNNTLNLGKTNCLAKLNILSNVKISNNNVIQYNVLTDKIDGDGIIERQNIETIYNEKKGCFDYFTKLIRINEEYNCQYSYDINEEEKGLYLWKYNKVGDIKCYKELI